MNRILIALAALGVAGCIAIGDSTRPIAAETFAAPRQQPAARTLVIVLPGFGVDAQEMRDRGIARTIQEAWPEADVLLASATFAYYRDGRLVSRLHHDIVAPAVRAGYRRIWLAGASMGGMGALLYEREHGALLAGVVLFAPFLGDNALLEEIRKAGGLRSWDPGPLPESIDATNYQRQVWKMVRDWTERPERASRVWVASGSEDRLVSGARLLATALPEGRFIEMSGGHTWSTWIVLGKAVFSRIRTVEPDAL
jgi:pimeloyl-ACP methyl ester carboxylesterase